MVSAGANGQVESSFLQKLDLSRSAKDQYPLALIKLMTRYAEDLIWANKINDGEAVFNFIVTLTEGRSGASEFRKGKFLLVTSIDSHSKKCYTINICHSLAQVPYWVFRLRFCNTD